MTDLVPLADVTAMRAGSPPALVADELGRHRAGWLLGFASANTRRAYSTDLDRWLAFCAHNNLDPLTTRRAHLDGWARTLEASGLSARTVARRLASVSSFFAYLVAEEVVGHSPAEHVRRPKVPDRGETPGLNRDELRRLLRAAEMHGSARAIALLTLLATTGLRINEALSRDVVPGIGLGGQIGAGSLVEFHFGGTRASTLRALTARRRCSIGCHSARPAQC